MSRAGIAWLVVGLVGIALLGIGVEHDARRCAAAWLVAWAWCFSIAVGALGAVILIEACGGTWHIAIRRGAEALYATLPALALLFIPVALSVRLLYSWTAPERLTPKLAEIVTARQPLQSPANFCVRSVIYLTVFVAIGGILRRLSLRMDADGAPSLARRHYAWCCGAAPFYALALTGAALDWFMSLDPQQASTVYAPWIYASSVLAAAAAWTLAVLVAQRRLALPLSSDHLVALGRLQLAFVIFAAYLAFSQLIVVYMADLPNEVPWYRTRFAGSWGVLGLVVGIGQYALPFLAMLSQHLKRRPWLLGATAAWVVVAHYLDLYWWLMPALYPAGIPWHWSDAAALAAVGGLAAAYACQRLRRYERMPLREARLPASLAYEARIA